MFLLISSSSALCLTLHYSSSWRMQMNALEKGNSGDTDLSQLALDGERDFCFAGFYFLAESSTANVRAAG